MRKSTNSFLSPLLIAICSCLFSEFEAFGIQHPPSDPLHSSLLLFVLFLLLFCGLSFFRHAKFRLSLTALFILLAAFVLSMRRKDDGTSKFSGGGDGNGGRRWGRALSNDDS